MDQMEKKKKRSIEWGVMSELSHGRELAEQLTNHLSTATSSSSSHRDFLLSQILSCYENVISELTSATSTTTGSGCCTPVSSQDYKKRRTKAGSGGRREQVRVCSSQHDGYCWRKYGQKDILGATFPRGYYRCSHRHTQGCLATKQVQKSDQDPTVFEVSYRGRHTCVQSSTASKPIIDHKPKQEPQDLPIVVDTQHTCMVDDIFPSFSFPSQQPLALDDIFAVDVVDGFMGSYSPDFLSPASSDSNYFSAQTSAANSPIGDLDFSFDDNLECFFSAIQS